MPETVKLGTEAFALADKIGLMPLMRFAAVAKRGVDSNEVDGLVAMYELIEQCIAPAEWERFQAHAAATRADGDELMKVVEQAIEAIAERPTSRPSDSSDGPTSTGRSSAGASSSPVVQRLEAQGRPDFALMVVKTQEAQAS